MVESSKSCPMTGRMFKCGSQIVRLENRPGKLIQRGSSYSWTDGRQHCISRGEDRFKHLLLSSFNRTDVVRARDIRPVPVGIRMTSDHYQVALRNLSGTGTGKWAVSLGRVRP